MLAQWSLPSANVAGNGSHGSQQHGAADAGAGRNHNPNHPASRRFGLNGYQFSGLTIRCRRDVGACATRRCRAMAPRPIASRHSVVWPCHLYYADGMIDVSQIKQTGQGQAMTYHLLTGATGLLGSYLLRDCLRQGHRLAVLVRPSRRESGRQRIEAILSRCEGDLGTVLPRPVVIEGELTEADLGLDQAGLHWISRHCRSVIHNAANLTFHGSGRQGEPWHTNFDGTRRILDLCRTTGIRQFHYISTAYVCGLREGRVLETELDVGQTPGNDYELSKIEAEKLVRARRLARSAHDLSPSHHRGRLADGLHGHLPRLLCFGEAGPHPGQPDGAGVYGRSGVGPGARPVGRGSQKLGAGGLGFGRLRAHFLAGRASWPDIPLGYAAPAVAGVDCPT